MKPISGCHASSVGLLLAWLLSLAINLSCAADSLAIDSGLSDTVGTFTTSSGSRGVPERLAYSAGVISSNVSNRGTRSIPSFAAPFNPVPSV